MTSLTFRQATPADAERCFEIESSAYDGDEAATLQKIRTRIAIYPEGFLILEVRGRIAGFVNSGCAHQVRMSNEAFKELIGHDPAAPNVVVMSVVVEPASQGNGFSSRLMRRFIDEMTKRGKTSIHLMCKDRHVPLYQHFGFEYVKPSASTHGGMAWHEMVLTLPFTLPASPRPPAP